MKKAEWELLNSFQRLGLRNKPGRKPQWRWNKKSGKLSRTGRGGIDWWAYQQQVLIPKLIPFAKECTKALLKPAIVQEDKAPAHAYWYQQYIFDLHQVERMIWMGNSPDLNAIEPTWSHLKRKTTQKGAPQTRKDGIKAWETAWKELPQHLIQAWIERIPVHIKKIIELEGGNEYKEGRDHVRQRRRYRIYSPASYIATAALMQPPMNIAI